MPTGVLKTKNKIEDIKNSQICLFILPSSQDSDLMRLVSMLSETASGLCYISFRRPCVTFFKDLKKAKVDPAKWMFIDMVSKGSAPKGCVFIGSPYALTRLNIELTNTMEKNEMYVIDSLNAMEVYHDEKTILRFVQAVSSQIRAANKKLVLVAFKDNSSAVRDSVMFVDSIIEA